MISKRPIVFLRATLLAFVCCVSGLAKGQIQAYNISLVSENIALPFTRFHQVHPGLEACITLRSQEKTRSIRTINLQLGGYYHGHFNKALYLQGQYTYAFKMGEALSIDLPLSIGYKHNFLSNDLYELDQQTGEFTKAKSLGRPQLMVSAGVGLSYRKHPRFTPFIRHEFAVQAPFSVFFPILPHTFTKVGLTVNLSQNAE